MNVLGPLLNPACAEYEVLGVYSPALLKDYAKAAKALGAKRVMVVCSRDGYDEISPKQLPAISCRHPAQSRRDVPRGPC